jgi:uncharacterized caspase-like protein
LMPVDSRLEDEFSINYELTRVDDVLFALERARGVKILVLDACRNNPLADQLVQRGTTRNVRPTRGLARIEPVRGMVVAYATQPNQVAVDGSGRNSPFTAALVKEIQQPGVEIATLFRRVATNVDRETGGRQLPELSISMFGEFYLNLAETDVQAWTKVRESSNVQELQEFLRRHPRSFLAVDAQRRIALLERDQSHQQQRLLEQAERAQRDEAQRKSERDRLEQQARREEQAERDRLQREAQAEEERKRIERDRLQREAKALAPAERDPIREKPSEPSAAGVQTANLAPSNVAAPAQAAVPPAFNKDLVLDIKRELKRVGCYAGPINDKWATVEIISSVERFAKHAGLQTPDYPSQEFLGAIRSKSLRFCPVICGEGFRVSDGRCVRIACKSGEVRNASGSCVRVAAKPQKPEREKPSKRSGAPGRPSAPDVTDDTDY